jgi:flavin-dependent dehydrogenase
MFDVLVIGAGPAGLMAARGAAQGGLRVAVVEKRSDVTKLTRACSQQFIIDEGYEGEDMRLQNGSIIFPRNGFEVVYNGPAISITDIYHISPGGHTIHLKSKDNIPLAIKYDKELLLTGIWEQCNKCGVEFINGAVAYDAADNGSEVEVKLTQKGVRFSLLAKKIVVADGVNSRIADALGMNKDRLFFGAPRCMLYVMDNVKDFDGHSWKQYHTGAPYPSKTPVIIEPALEGGTVADVITTGGKGRSPEQVYQDITTTGPLAPLFENTKLLRKQGCALNLYTPMKVPYKGNALAIGDAATFAEVEVQGALMCGFQGGNAVLREINGEPGFKDYTTWWLSSFEFHREEELIGAVSNLLAATLYTEEDLDYMYSLAEGEVLDGTYNQWKQHKRVWGAIIKHEDRIAQEQPMLHEKIKKFQERKKTLTLNDIYKSL